MKRSNRMKRNVHPRRSEKDFQALSHRILEYANQGLLRMNFQREVSRMILDFVGCDAVELWLKDHGKYFCSEVKRHLQKPFLFEIRSSAQNENGEIIPGPDDDPNLICLCNNIVHDHVDPSQTMFTENGSFWIGNLKKPFSLRLKSFRKSHVRDFKIGGNYQSLLLIPLIVNRQNIGLLQLKSNSKNYFKKDKIELYEGLARSLEIAAAHRDAQIDLRERIKELTCLFGIARLAAQSHKSIEEILQGIVELLPPAWLYPGITFAKILLDEHSYSTSGFQEGKHKQTADIIVSEKRRGMVEVVYEEEKPELDEGPFLKEERNLIDAVASEVSNIIKRREVEDDQLKLQKQLIRSEKMAALGQLSAGIAHEIRTPLTSIKIFIQSLEKEIDLDENQKEDFRIIKKEIDRINENITRFLNFARPEDPLLQQVNINGLIKDTLNLLTAKIKNSGIHLKISLLKDCPPVEGDAKQLGQVFLNLLLNAIEAMPRGGILTVRSIIETTPETHEESLKLFIQDTGSGIPERDKPYLFDPFFTTKEGGTGLGLSIVYSIIQKHNGQIEVESELGRGSSFILSLPVQKEGTWKESP
jgi:two-component system NtrC family sensor kinase